ncbi:hypothetical protein R3P38DRAFT_84161 [Favolaschia claudopus]|uniref:Uncharacterized protein n=1 Tax=Favolaschia claudopus TaxID=2862362 RepID=A0AAW0D700_9AGAR
MFFLVCPSKMHPYIHPSVPRSPSSGSPAPLGPSNGANVQIPPRPDYANLNPRRPSEHWLNSLNPGWIDGASEPPIFFFSQEEIAMTMLTWNPGHPMFKPVVSAAPVPADSSALGQPPAYIDTTVAASDAPQAGAAQTGYQVSVVVHFSAPDLTNLTKTGIRSKPLLKQIKNTKLAIIDVIHMDRCAFIKAILAVHEYADDYSPGVNRGPPFKMSWTGSSGGRGHSAKPVL